MRALVYTAPRRLVVEERPLPADGEVEIAVTAAGICGADIAGFLGRSRHRTPPLILGHELVGRTAGGQRVVVDPVIGCGHCAHCRSGQKNLCPSLRLLGMDPLAGCFAEFVSVPHAQVHKIPEQLADHHAILAEPLANVVHLFRLAAPPPTARIGIVGAGLMGSLALQLVQHLGAAEVLVEDVDELRLTAARQIGATLAVNVAAGHSGARSLALNKLDLVIDACGAESARQRAFDLCRPGGTVVLLGLASEHSAINFAASIRKEQRVLMSFGYTDADFSRSLTLLRAGAIHLAPWTAEMPLADGQKAFERMADARGDALKMVLRVR